MAHNRRNQERKILRYGVVEGGHDKDPDPEQAGRVRIRFPEIHGKNVKQSDLPFIPSASPHEGQYAFNRPPKPGQTIMAMMEEDGYVVNLGPVTGVEKATKEGSGGGQAMDSIVSELGQAATKMLNIAIPPDMTGEMKPNETGFEKLNKKKEEKGKDDHHALYLGLPSNGAMNALSGLRFSNITQIATARAHLSNSLTPSVLAQMPGSLFGLGSLLQIIGNVAGSELMGSMSSQMQAATQNLLQLIPSEKGLKSPGNFDFAGKSNPATMGQNAANAFKGAKNVSDLAKACQTCFAATGSNANTAFTGMDEFDDIEIEYEGAHGQQMVCTVSCSTSNARTSAAASNGRHGQTDEETGQPQTQKQNAQQVVNNIIKAFMSLLAGIPSADPGTPLFGSNTQLPDMKERLGKMSSVREMTTAMKNMAPSSSTERQELQNGKGQWNIGASYLSGGGNISA